MRNKYPSSCSSCSAAVPARAGTLSRSRSTWIVTCAPCTDGVPVHDADALAISRGNSTSYGVVTSTGWVGYRNRAGRCEDAPCCGCCTF